MKKHLELGNSIHNTIHSRKENIHLTLPSWLNEMFCCNEIPSIYEYGAYVIYYWDHLNSVHNPLRAVKACIDISHQESWQQIDSNHIPAMVTYGEML